MSQNLSHDGDGDLTRSIPEVRNPDWGVEIDLVQALASADDLLSDTGDLAATPHYSEIGEMRRLLPKYRHEDR